MKPSPSRRRFLTAAALGPAGLALPARSAEKGEKPGMFTEEARDLPLHTDADVIVCGAGPAGLAAAVTAARAGAKVRLFELHGSLGGVWTSSLLGYLLDFDKPGFNVELVTKLRERDGIRGKGMNGLAYHPEEMKVLLEELCAEANVTVHFHTRVSAAHRKGRQLTTILTESKSGREAWRAPVFIDTTGDGDLGAMAACEFEIGESAACPCQPMSMDALLLVKDAALLDGIIHGTRENVRETKKAFLAEIKAAGIEPSYGAPTLFPVRDNLLLAMMNHEYGVNATDAPAVTNATLNSRAELNRIVRGLRKLGGKWEGLQLVATPEQIGIRDGRRIKGRYTVSEKDLVQGARHDDAVVRATFPVDIHALSAEHNKTSPYSGAGVKTQPYDIPLRALIARDVDGLMMAGRCISGDFIAHASYRVTGNAVAMGEAAGAVAAIASRSRRQPHEILWKDAKEVIAKARTMA